MRRSADASELDQPRNGDDARRRVDDRIRRRHDACPHESLAGPGIGHRFGFYCRRVSETPTQLLGRNGTARP